MFKIGNIVRHNSDLDNLLKVIGTISGGSGKIREMITVEYEDGTAESFPCEELELVTEAIDILADEHKPQEANVSNRTYKEIHEDITKMYAQVTQWLRSNGHDKKIDLSIECEHYSKDSDELDVSFNCSLEYGATIRSDNLFRSADVALRRTKENELLKPLSIPFFKDAAE